MSVMILRGDARQLPLADASVHLIVTSPPYNARIAYDGYDDNLPWAEYWEGLIRPALAECYRVLVAGGRLCLNLPNVVRTAIRPDNLRARARRNGRAYTSAGRPEEGRGWPIMVAARIWPLLEEMGFLPREQLAWVKGLDPADTPTNSTAWGTWCSARNPVLRAVVEPVFIASKGRHEREPGPSDLTPEEFKAWTRNAWSISPSAGGARPDHPAAFPLELPRRLIKLYSYPGDTVLDPFAGSGTTLLAAQRLGRRAIGVELSARYAALCRDRTAQQLLPLEVG